MSTGNPQSFVGIMTPAVLISSLTMPGKAEVVPKDGLVTPSTHGRQVTRIIGISRGNSRSFLNIGSSDRPSRRLQAYAASVAPSYGMPRFRAVRLSPQAPADWLRGFVRVQSPPFPPALRSPPNSGGQGLAAP